MANSTFSIPFTQTPKEVLAGAKSTIIAAKGTFEGNTSSGKFTIPLPVGEIAGKYTMADSVIHIEITKKPFVVTNGMMEKQLRRMLEPKKG